MAGIGIIENMDISWVVKHLCPSNGNMNRDVWNRRVHFARLWQVIQMTRVSISSHWRNCLYARYCAMLRGHVPIVLPPNSGTHGFLHSKYPPPPHCRCCHYCYCCCHRYCCCCYYYPGLVARGPLHLRSIEMNRSWSDEIARLHQENDMLWY